MFKLVVFSLLLVLLSCSNADEEIAADPIIDLLQQGIYADIGYGQNHNSSYRCTLPFASQRCDAPDSKTVAIYIDTDNCVGPFLGWVEDATYQFADFMSQNDWDVQVIGEGNESSAMSELGISVIGCSTSKASIALASTQISFAGADCNAAGPGTWCQYKRGSVMNVFPYTLTNSKGWKNAQPWQREFVLNNTVWHEWLHVLGLGHHPDLAQFDRLMHNGVNIDNHDNLWWNELLWPAPEELQWLQRYNPTSGTSPH